MAILTRLSGGVNEKVCRSGNFRHFFLTMPRGGAIMQTVKMALTEKKPLCPTQRGARLVQAPCGGGGRTTPEPPGTTGTGLSRYRKARAAGDDVLRQAGWNRGEEARSRREPRGWTEARARDGPQGPDTARVGGKPRAANRRSVTIPSPLIFVRGDFLLLTPHYKEE